MQRIHTSAEIQSNVSLSNGRLDNTALAKLVSHLKTLSKGSYLYLKLTLDLIEGGYLVLKSSSFKVRKRLRKYFILFFHSNNTAMKQTSRNAFWTRQTQIFLGVVDSR